MEDGLFVLEVHDQCNPVEAKNIQTIVFDACVREYDLQLFNSFVLDEQSTYIHGIETKQEGLLSVITDNKPSWLLK